MIFTPFFLLFAVGRLGLELLEIFDVRTHPFVDAHALIPIAGIEDARDHHHLDEFDEIDEDRVQLGDPWANDPKTTGLQAVTTIAAKQVFTGVAVPALTTRAPLT